MIYFSVFELEISLEDFWGNLGYSFYLIIRPRILKTSPKRIIIPTSGRGETDNVTTRTVSRDANTVSLCCLSEDILLFV